MAETRRLKVLGVCGSLRKGSFNRMALNAAIELAPPGLEIETFEIAPIPPYNEDLRAAGFPPAVEEFRARIKAADALLIATPEYNFSIPGVLKNAIDWASRPPDQPFNGKPVAILGSSPGGVGTARSQQHLRQVCTFLNMYPVNKPEVLIGAAASKFDAAGKLTDEATRGFVKDLMVALEAWTRRLGA
ncbi:MAG TPA: NADPH-dependent FMN reductase [Alphaproteobacteria bacterium]|nr:NADPH-dependent FMN reductase [Alphaproteobacteria bacterium]